MSYEHFILNNVALCETFMSAYQIRIDKIPDVLIIDYRDLNRYVFEYIDDAISQYADWCATTNKAEDVEMELRGKVALFGSAYGVNMTPHLDAWFEALDKMVLSIMDDCIRQIHDGTSRSLVYKAHVFSDGTIAVENMGESSNG